MVPDVPQRFLSTATTKLTRVKTDAPQEHRTKPCVHECAPERLEMATSLGPLTTSFSPPAGCLASTVTWQLPNPSSTDSYFLQGRPSVARCFPDNYDPHTTAYYAPGICPSAYTAVQNREGKSFSTTEVLTCCPTQVHLRRDELKVERLLICR